MKSVSCALRAINRYAISPDRYDETILCAINASLTMTSDGRASEGWNRDLWRNGREWGWHYRKHIGLE